MKIKKIIEVFTNEIKDEKIEDENEIVSSIDDNEIPEIEEIVIEPQNVEIEEVPSEQPEEIKPIQLEPEQELVEIEKPEDTQIIKNAYTSSLNDIVQKIWELISDINSVIATIDYTHDCPDYENVCAILNGIVDDSTISIGMLTKVLTIIDTKTGELLTAGEQKAEEIVE